MSRGGKREGAGRKPSALTQRTRAIAEATAETGITPLEYLLSIMRDELEEKPLRLDCAKAAAPYVHPRLAAIDAKIEGHLTLGSALDALDD